MTDLTAEKQPVHGNRALREAAGYLLSKSRNTYLLFADLTPKSPLVDNCMFRPFKRLDLYILIALIAAIAAAWCIVEHRLTAQDWRVPLSAASDGLSALAGTKAAAEGNFPLVMLKFNPQLGAPLSANWNDWPTTEEILFVVSGIFARYLGVFTASNLMVLLAHILAGVSFYVVCRLLRYRRPWAAVAGLAFALSHYAFQRGLGHLGLTYYWHIPLCLLVVWWCGSRRGLTVTGGRFWFGLAVGFTTGVQNPYYTNVFLQLLGLTALAQILRGRWKKAAAPILLGTAAVAGFILMNLDTVYYQHAHGRNPEPAYRSYQNLEIYALKPIELLIPPPDHRAPAARAFAWRYLYDDTYKTSVRGEFFFPYLGIAGIAALAALGIASIKRVAAFPRRPLPVHALLIVWLTLYSVVGGLNGILGQIGLTAFRCTDRNSIFILALVLFYGVKALSRLTSRWNPAVVTASALALVPLILWDQLPPVETRSSVDRIRAALSSDRVFSLAMQKALPSGAMIFQLPVMRFPESWPINQMGDYEHFRPYLYTSSLHYSYGSDKGRSEDDWQLDVARRTPHAMALALERAGFAAIYINRKGFPDSGATLIDGLRTDGYRGLIESPAHDLVCVLLHPSNAPKLPETPPQFTAGWYAEEGSLAENWHCSNGDAEILLHNDSTEEQIVQISFQLVSHSPRTVRLYIGDDLVYKSPLLSPEKLSHFFNLRLKPGVTKLSFKTEPPVRFPGNPDTRLLGFVLYNFRASREVLDDGTAR
jgi:hypothetical protein